MRVVLALILATFVLAGCKRETQEAVAQAKGAAADAERAAKETADQAKTAADDAAAKARAAAEQARVAASGATDSAKQTLDSTGQKLREMTAGDQVQGVLVGTGSSDVSVRPASGPVQTFHTDAQTRWILRGAAAGKEGFPAGSTVRITYIVRNGQRFATQVEAITR